MSKPFQCEGWKLEPSQGSIKTFFVHDTWDVSMQTEIQVVCHGSCHGDTLWVPATAGEYAAGTQGSKYINDGAGTALTQTGVYTGDCAVVAAPRDSSGVSIRMNSL